MFYFESLLGRLEYGWAPLRGVVIGAVLKYIDAPQAELYNLAADPLEETNLLEVQPDDATHLREELAKFSSGIEANVGTHDDARAPTRSPGLRRCSTRR